MLVLEDTVEPQCAARDHVPLPLVMTDLQCDQVVELIGVARALECKSLPAYKTTESGTTGEASFHALGVTEKELGGNFKERMINIARIRKALNGVGLENMPIHIFGSLDTVSTPLVLWPAQIFLMGSLGSDLHIIKE